MEWVNASLPDGGTGYQRPQWSDAKVARLANRFFASSYGVELDDEDNRRMLDSVLWFGTDYGPGDPLRWSPVNVEILLTDWIPRKIVAEVAYLAQAPRLLRAFIQFCHADRGVRPALATETLAAVDYWEPDYQRIIRSPRPQGAAALLAAMGVLDPVGEALALVDRCCDELLSGEYRTACRRLLARAASGDGDVFRRRGRIDTLAAAVVWIVGKANDLFGAYGGRGMLVKDLMGHFGLRQGGVSQRATALRRAGGFDRDQFGNPALGSPDCLVSTRRQEIIEIRDRCKASRDS